MKNLALKVMALAAVATSLLLSANGAFAQDAGDAAIAGGLSALLGDYSAPVATLGLGVVALAKLICAFTTTPDPATPAGKAYTYLQYAALIFGRMKQAIVLTVAVGAAVMLTACSQVQQDVQSAAADPTKAMDDACYFATSAKASFQLFVDAGKVDAAGKARFEEYAPTVDSLCTQPYPADTRQAVSKLLLAGTQLAIALTPDAKD